MTEMNQHTPGRKKGRKTDPDAPQSLREEELEELSIDAEKLALAGDVDGARQLLREVKRMANEGNLKPVRTEAEAREKGRRGGIASGAARRHKASLRAALKVLLAEQYVDSWDGATGRTMAEQAAYKLARLAANGDLKAIAMLLKLEEPARPDPAGEEADALL